jgi:hypothetical protein
MSVFSLNEMQLKHGPFMIVVTLCGFMDIDDLKLRPVVVHLLIAVSLNQN